jgi:two-component system cell cycle response regulator DivK
MAGQASTPKINVLIVDDVAETRENIRKLLQFEPDIEVVGMARTGREGIQLAKEAKPHVVLMDINMPDMDGYTLTARIKTTPGFERVPILALTANVMRGDKEKTLEAGCDGYIQKPLDIDQLIREVERFLARSA